MQTYAPLILFYFLSCGDVVLARPRENPVLVRRHGNDGRSWPMVRRNETVPTHTPSPVAPVTTLLPPPTSLPPSIAPSQTPAAPTTTPAPFTVSNGETKDGSDLAVGAIVAAGVGGGFLAIGGALFSMGAGSTAAVTGGAGALAGIPSGLSSLSGPEPQEVDNPEDPDDPDDPEEPEEPQSSEPTPTSTTPPTTSAPPETSTAPTTTTAMPTSSAPPQPLWIIMPSDTGSEADVEEARLSLEELAGSSLGTVEDDEDGSVLFYTAALTPDVVDQLEAMPGIESVSEDLIIGEMSDLVAELPFVEADAVGPSGPPPALLPGQDPLTVAKQPKSIVRQSGYSDEEPLFDLLPGSEEAMELCVLSQEPGKYITTTFAYDKTAGEGITVYILGTGMNLQTPDIKTAVGAKDFIYAPGAEETPTDETNFGMEDGTCMASKIFGPKYGVAKKANVVMVKMSPEQRKQGSITMIEMLTALAMVKNDIHVRGLKGKAVVSLTYTTPIDDEEIIGAYKEILVSMMDDDIVLVAPTGLTNNGNSQANDQYPAAFAKDTALIAVSAVNAKGKQLNWSPGSVDDGVTVAAPATGFCAYRTFNPKDRATLPQMQNLERRYYSEGVAAATVAGVVAGLMAQEEYQEQLQQPGKVAANVKELVQGLAWTRAEGGPPIVWNGVVPYANNCRRQEGGSCARPTSTATFTPTAAPTKVATKLPQATAVPTSSPKPVWDPIPTTWQKQFEGDGVYSFDYTATSDTASEGYSGDPLVWCFDKCADGCMSVFLTRVKQPAPAEDYYYICNQYAGVWSNDFLQENAGDTYDAAIALDKLPIG